MGNCLAASSLTPHNTAVAVQKDEERVHPTVKTTAETKTSKKVANGTTKAANGTATTTSSSSPPSSAQSKATPSFSYTKGVCALEYWEPIELIGEGSISSIHLVRRRPERIRVPYKERAEIMNFSSCAGSDDRSNKKGSCSPDECKQEGKVYALKSIMKDLVRNDRYLEELRREVHTMSQLRHPNIVSVVEAYERKRHIYVILEYCSGGDLYEMEGTTEHNAQAIVRHILQAVAYMHAHKVVHRDLKLENVVFATKQRRPEEVKIIDFGLATKYLSDEYKSMTDKVGTIYTMAPQVLQGVYDLKCDMWSIGVITYILLSGSQPFWGPVRDMPWEKRRKIMMDRILRCDYKRMQRGVWDSISQEAKNSVGSLLQCDPDARPTAKEALRSPWMKMEFDDKERKETARADAPSTPSTSQRSLQKFKLAVAFVSYKVSSEELETVRSRCESLDVKDAGSVGVAAFKMAVLDSTRLSNAELPSHFLDLLGGTTKLVHYHEFVNLAQEVRARFETERCAEALDQLDKEETGNVCCEHVRTALHDKLSPQMLADILHEVDTDSDECFSCRDFMELVASRMKRRLESTHLNSSRDEQDVDEEGDDLADPTNASVPGGMASPGHKLKYVYDPSSKSVQKCSC